jgi:hypothetical protein
MAFRSVNLNPPRGPRSGGGGGRGGGNNYRGGGGGGSVGFNTALRIDASGRVDQGFGPVGGAAAVADADFDIFGIDDPSTFQTQPQPASQQPILYAPSLFFFKLFLVVRLDQWNTMFLYHSSLDLLNVPFCSPFQPSLL